MSREKQIECASCLHYNACLINSEYVPSPCRAYENNAGYRKQSEGEWKLEHEFYGKMLCSNCKKEALANENSEYVDSDFCPNCGAKMKGGAE